MICQVTLASLEDDPQNLGFITQKESLAYIFLEQYHELKATKCNPPIMKRKQKVWVQIMIFQ